MQLQFLKVKSSSDIDIICSLANEIWHEHYASIISTTQINYMLDTFQSPNAVQKQLLAGFQYFIIIEDDSPIGYISTLANQAKSELFLSKFYLLKKFRGRGFGKLSMDRVVQMALAQKLNSIYLTVNNQNLTAIHFYQKMGFKIMAELVTDIGGGFVMDDFKMLKS
jgi:diamine N-acetyltransferase